MSTEALTALLKKIHWRELIVFGFVGVAATLTHYLCALASNEWLGISLYIANLIGYLCAVAVSYVGHSKFTFQVDFSRRLFWRFVLVSVATFGLSELLLLGLEWLQLHHRLSLAIVVMTIPLISYLLNKFWVFK